MTKQTRKFLTTLRQQFRAANDTTKRQIWNILSALRGPDSENWGIGIREKSATTAIIRHKVFGATLENSSVGVSSHPDRQDYADYRKTDNFISSHFSSHTKEAFSALNLKWSEVNTPKTKKKTKKKIKK